MKRIIYLSIFFITFFLFQHALSQENTTDTISARIFMDKGKRCIDELNIDSAVIYFEKAQIIYKNTSQVNDYAKASNGLGESLVRNNKSLKGLLLLQNTQKYIIDNIGETNLILADNYNKIAIAYYFMSDFNEAIVNLNKSLELKVELLPSNDKSLADTYNNLGVIYDMLGEKDKAIEAYLKSLEIIRNQEIPKQVDLANTLENIAMAYIDLTKNDIALKYEKEAKDIFLKEFGENHLKYLNSYELIGVIYYSMEQYKQAELIIKEVFAKKSKLLEPTNPYMINTYINLGNLYFELGDANKSLELHLEALNYYKQYSGTEESYTFIDLCNNIGNNYDELGQHELAIEYFLRAINIGKKLFGKKHIVFATYYNNIAATLFNLKDYEKALEYFLDAKEILLKDESSLKTLINIYTNLASCYYYLGNEKECNDYFNKSIQLSKEVYEEPTASLATIYANKAAVHINNQEYHEAQKYLHKSLAFRKNAFGIKNPNVASTYASLGIINYENEQPDSALINYQLALFANLPKWEINQAEIIHLEYKHCPVFEIPYSYFELIRAGIQKTVVFQDLYDTTEDADYLYLARNHYFFVDTAITEFRKGLTKKSERLIYSEMLGDVYPNAAYTCYQIFNLTNDSTYLEEAFYFLQKGKSLLLMETMNSINARKIAGIPEELLEQERNITDEISRYRRQMLSGNVNEVEDYYNKVFVLNNQLRDLIKLLEKEYPDYYNLKYNLNLKSIKEIQSLIDTTDCMISYVDGEMFYLVGYLTKKNFKIEKIDISENFNESIDYLRRSMMYPESERLNELYRNYAYEVYHKIFPNNLPTDIKNIILIPDSKLSIIPFEALLTEKIGSGLRFTDYPFLIKKFNISYQYSEMLVYDNFKEQKEYKNDFIAFAPVFDNESTGTANRNTNNILQNVQHVSDTLPIKTRMIERNMISALPGTEEEVRLIYELFNEKNQLAKAYLNESADEETVKNINLMDYGFIHFATHGFADTENPELSGLVLAQDTLHKEDNILFLDEILSLKMDPDLVVLSACETGLGKMFKGEGLIGLSRALIYSGAKNISVSLWQVSDESTKKLMVYFYKNYLDNENKGFASSFRDAKLSLIKGEEYAHPFYWSPFILIGK